LSLGMGSENRCPTVSRHNFIRGDSMKLLKLLAKPAAWASGWTSAILCFSAAAGFWGAGEPRRAICWIVLGAAEVAAIVL
jgi:hypothetical protein